jgi:hypothetical protein
MSITRAQIARQLLNEMAPKGEKLAYINNREAELLKRMGGAGKNINETGIKSYYYDEVGQTMGGTGFQDTSSLTGGSGGGGGGSYDYIPQPTVAKKVDTAPKRGSGALTAGSLFPGYLKNFEYAALRMLEVETQDIAILLVQVQALQVKILRHKL